MIVLHPSLSVERFFSFVDFDVLSAALTSCCAMVHGKHFDQVIRVFKSRNHDYYEGGSNAIFLKFEKRSIEYVISTMVHEMRHWQQDVLYGMTFKDAEYDETSYDTYFNSPVEVDARNFESILSPSTIRMYRILLEVKDMSKTHGLKKFHKPKKAAATKDS